MCTRGFSQEAAPVERLDKKEITPHGDVSSNTKYTSIQINTDNVVIIIIMMMMVMMITMPMPSPPAFRAHP